MNNDPSENKALANPKNIDELSELIKLNTSIAAKQARFKKELELITKQGLPKNTFSINMDLQKKSMSFNQDISRLFNSCKSIADNSDLFNSIANYQRQLNYFSNKIGYLKSSNLSNLNGEFKRALTFHHLRMSKQHKQIESIISEIIKSQKDTSF